MRIEDTAKTIKTIPKVKKTGEKMQSKKIKVCAYIRVATYSQLTDEGV